MRDERRLAKVSCGVCGWRKAQPAGVFPYREKPDAEAHMFKALVIYNNKPEALVVNYIYLDVLMRDLSHYFGEK